MGYIYTITNIINGKQYVGKTDYVNPQTRWKEHIIDCRKRKLEHRPLYSAMNKYGVENFAFEVIEECDNTEEREKFWIKELNTYGSTGYNATRGGDGKSYIPYSDEEIIKYHCCEGKYVISRTAKNFKIDVSTVRNILRKHDVYWLSVEETSNLRNQENGWYVCQIDLYDDVVLNVFKNQKDALKSLGKYTRSSGISRVLDDITKQAYGYRWVRLNNIPNGYKYKDEVIKNSEYVLEYFKRLKSC